MNLTHQRSTYCYNHWLLSLRFFCTLLFGSIITICFWVRLRTEARCTFKDLHGCSSSITRISIIVVLQFLLKHWFTLIWPKLLFSPLIQAVKVRFGRIFLSAKMVWSSPWSKNNFVSCQWWANDALWPFEKYLNIICLVVAEIGLNDNACEDCSGWLWVKDILKTVGCVNKNSCLYAVNFSRFVGTFIVSFNVERHSVFLLCTPCIKAFLAYLHLVSAFCFCCLDVSCFFVMLAVHFYFKQNSLFSWSSSFSMAICVFTVAHHFLQPRLSLFFARYIHSNNCFKGIPWANRERQTWYAGVISDYICYIPWLGRTSCKAGTMAKHSSNLLLAD